MMESLAIIKVIPREREIITLATFLSESPSTEANHHPGKWLQLRRRSLSLINTKKDSPLQV